MENVDGFVSLKTHKELMAEKNLSFKEVEEEIFKRGLTPLRYKSNQNSLSQVEQYKLFKSHVLIVGCGGLGGNVSELLTRLGVGSLTLVDNDFYTEPNLNRQRFSAIETLGQNKAQVVAENLKLINPATSLHVKVARVDKTNIDEFASAVDVIIDAVDNAVTKSFLAKYSKEKNIKFVHGAIAGWVGQASTSKKIETLYRDGRGGAEKISGNLPFTACFCACMQASICTKLLLEKPLDEDDLLFFDLLDSQMDKILL